MALTIQNNIIKNTITENSLVLSLKIKSLIFSFTAPPGVGNAHLYINSWKPFIIMTKT